MTTTEERDNEEVALSLYKQKLVVVANCWPNERGTCMCRDHQRESGCSHNQDVTGKTPVFANWQTAQPTEKRIREVWKHKFNANVGLHLRLSHLLVVDTDNPEAVAECERRGITRAVVRTSRSPAYIYRAPHACPLVQAVHLGESGGLTVATDGQLVVHGIHRQWLDVYFETGQRTAMKLTDPPGWILEMVEEAALTPKKAPPQKIVAAHEPPVVLNDLQLRFWRGEVVAYLDGRPMVRKANSAINPDRTLWWIARILVKAGASRETIVRALAERDKTLALLTYTKRRDKGRSAYERLADEARATFEAAAQAKAHEAESAKVVEMENHESHLDRAQ